MTGRMPGEQGLYDSGMELRKESCTGESVRQAGNSHVIPRDNENIFRDALTPLYIYNVCGGWAMQLQ